MSGEHFDNSAIQRMQIAVMKRTQKLGSIGCQVLEVRFDGAKASIHVAPRANLVAQEHVGEYGVVQDGPIRVLWRETQKRGAEDD